MMTMMLAYGKKAGTKIDQDLKGMEYEGSDKVFSEKKETEETGETFDPEKSRQAAYDDYMKQYAEQTKTKQSIFADKEDQGIYWNLDVPSIEEHMESFDTLNFLYVYDSKTTVERDGQDWRVLDLMFFNTLQELEGGYATAFAYDCAWTGAT